jgi:flagellar basal-body rod protein FlgB
MVSKLDDYFRFNEMALNLRAQRQQVLASNIANADTPNYKARDVNFADALKNALDNKSNTIPPLQLDRTAASHVAGTAPESGRAALAARPCSTARRPRAAWTAIPSIWMWNAMNSSTTASVTKPASPP